MARCARNRLVTRDRLADHRRSERVADSQQDPLRGLLSNRAIAVPSRFLIRPNLKTLSSPFFFLSFCRPPDTFYIQCPNLIALNLFAAPVRPDLGRSDLNNNANTENKFFAIIGPRALILIPTSGNFRF